MSPSPPPASIESLPAEIAGQILDGLSLSELARLSVGSKLLRRRLEPVLFESETTRNRAMKESFPEPRPAHDTGPTKTLTLYLAAKYGQVHAFQHLLNLGAQIGDPGVDSHTVQALVKRICSPTGTDLLASFLKAGLASQLTQERRDDALLSVLTSTNITAQDQDSTNILLNSGANPSYHGAQLNIQTLILRNKRRRELSFTNPFFIYLGRISSWEGENGSTALQNIEYLLGNGATLEMDGIACPDDPALFSGRYRFQPPPTAIELLVDKWTAVQLSQPHFLSALKLLVRYGALRRHAGTFLARYDYDPSGNSLDPAAQSAWEELLDAMLADPSQHEDIHTLLYTYITAKGTRPKLDVYSSAKPTVTDLTLATVTRLLGAGADINTRPTSGDPTALHVLCWRYSKAEYLHDSGAEPSNLNFTERLNSNRARFLRFLVEQCGADPMAEWQGRRPAETLRLGRVKLGDTEKTRVDELIRFLEDRTTDTTM
ncbi:hypothetical protein GQ53DRAFT_758562 [Thozetella sp. PMI_491]|nr:hypothetical protein GQ53DRAFT_758562 [Thozetella sp. PMI_491]